MIGRPQRQPAAQQLQHRGSSTGAAVREPEVVRMGLLGGFRLWVGSRLIEEDRWSLRKARSLLKLLALSPGHRLHREQVMETLWPELGVHKASNNLHQILHAARRTLQPSALLANGSAAAASSGYLLLRDEQLLLCPDSPLWVDVDAFEQAGATARNAMEPAAFRAAIDLYAGELLPEDRYEPWLEERRAEIRGLYLSLLLALGTLYEERAYQADYGNAGLQPAPASYWRSFGPSDVYKNSAVVITAHPNTLVAGATFHRAMALQVSDTFVHQYPIVSGDIVTTEPHVGVWLTNTGQWPIRYVTFKVAVIKD